MPELTEFPDLENELSFIAERARAFHDAGSAWKDVAVLFRMHYQGERIAAALEGAGIPVSLFGKDKGQRKYQPNEDSVKLMTFHSSKGLEFPIVFCPFLETMPHMKDDVPGEAKLLYVAMTRAMDHLLLTHHAESLFVGRARDAVRVCAVA